MVLRSIQRNLVGHFAGGYHRWIKKYDTLSATDRQTMVEQALQFAYQPVISVVIPVYKPNPSFFTAAIQSVLKQIYPKWELILVEDASQEGTSKKIMADFAKQDARIKPIFLEKNLGISGATNAGIKIAQGEFIAFVDHDDLLAENALYELIKALNEEPADILYSDSDHANAKNQRSDPSFKPDWDPYLLLFQHYMCHLFVARKSLIDEVGGLRSAFNGSQDWDLALRLTEKTTRICHIPKILYHWRRLVGGSFSQKHYEKTKEVARHAISEHLSRRGIAAEVKNSDQMSYPDVIFQLPETLPLISVIIPTKDGLEMLEPCIKSILAQAKQAHFEILIVNNNSEKQETLDYFKAIASEQIQILDYPHPFNFAAINNFAVKQARGEVLLFLNNDIEAISEGWMESMLSLLLQKDVGIVGAKLYYPNLKIQHAGMVLEGNGNAIHVHAGLDKSAQGYFSRLHHIQCFSAVTGACLMIKKALFDQVGGFDEVRFPITFNDVDLCIKVREAGFRILFDPYAELYHKESATRGHDTTPEKRARALKEAQAFCNKWGDKIKLDPFYNPNLSFVLPGYRLAFPPAGILE